MLSGLVQLLCCVLLMMGLVNCLSKENKSIKNEKLPASTKNSSINQPHSPKHIYLNPNEISEEKYNNSNQFIPKKNLTHKPKRKRKIKKEISPETTLNRTVTELSEPTKRKRKRRRRKKKKQNANNILEVTTAKNFRTINMTLLSILNEGMGNITTQDQIATAFIQKFANSKHSKKQNRCSKKNGRCSQICNERGKNKCSCLLGYKLAKNRKKCVDVNECQSKNGGCKQICRNTLGAYHCDCIEGLRLTDDLRTCQDINECHLRNGHGPCQDTCTNTHGSYICDCMQLNGTRLSSDKHTCEDINECEERSPGCSHLCINTKVGAFCSCPAGLELVSDYKTCQDVDECENIKACRNGCVNTIGSYYCEENIQNDESLNVAKIPVCPPLDPPPLGFITCFRNNTTPFDTFTNDGRKIIRNTPGTKCQLHCPIGFKLIGGNRFICEISGKWKIRKKGFCAKAVAPKIECPPNQILFSKEDNGKINVNLPRPRTNVKWKIVKSYPAWARNLKGELELGQHFIQFSVTDPMTELSAKCSFSIIVKK